MGGADDARIESDVLVPAQALDRALLEEAQQRRLRLQRQVADLVQEQGAAVGMLEATALALGGAGEGAALEAEQLGLHQAFRDRAAVDDHQRRPVPLRMAMDRGRRQLLASSGAAADAHRRVGQRRALQLPVERVHHRALADHAVHRRHRTWHGPAAVLQPRHAVGMTEHGGEQAVLAGQHHVVVAVVTHQPPHRFKLHLARGEARHPAQPAAGEHLADAFEPMRRGLAAAAKVQQAGAARVRTARRQRRDRIGRRHLARLPAALGQARGQGFDHAAPGHHPMDESAHSSASRHALAPHPPPSDGLPCPCPLTPTRPHRPSGQARARRPADAAPGRIQNRIGRRATRVTSGVSRVMPAPSAMLRLVRSLMR